MRFQSAGKAISIQIIFDIIVLRDNVAIKVREKRITAILPAADYVYDNVPVINGRGFAVLAQSNEDVQQFLKEYEAVRESEQTAFFCQCGYWFDTYRKVIFHPDGKIVSIIFALLKACLSNADKLSFFSLFSSFFIKNRHKT